MELVEIKGLSFIYPDGTKALENVSLSLERGSFTVLMGATGSGKSTLLRALKPELRQNGDISGEILFGGSDIAGLSARESAERIGYVSQHPDEQIVTDKVWHELAFTLESLGARRDRIARRIAEICSFFDIDDLYDRSTATLSGGQKQLISLAAVMTADPELLILDEPTAQLDPIAAARFIEALYRLNRETGVTVLIGEHRAEELLPRCDGIILLDGGRLKYSGSPRKFADELPSDSPYLSCLPTAARIFRAAGGSREAPLSVREGQAFLDTLNLTVRSLPNDSKTDTGEPALEMKNVCFRYEKSGGDILSDMSLTVNRGEVFALLGANGTGKSTLSAVAAGLLKPYSGSVRLFSKKLGDYRGGSLYKGCLSLLPQDVESVFIHETVREELKGCENAAELLPYDLTPLLDHHPYDISGGERQLVALCKALSTEPRMIIMDEPSKGLDINSKKLLVGVVRALKDKGVTVLLISHDVDFAASCADRCAMFSRGRIAACDYTGRFMSDNRFYTTAASRVTRGVFDGAYTLERVEKLIKLNGGAT